MNPAFPAMAVGSSVAATVLSSLEQEGDGDAKVLTAKIDGQNYFGLLLPMDGVNRSEASHIFARLASFIAAREKKAQKRRAKPRAASSPTSAMSCARP